jgi:hypothetical protein
MSSAPGYPSTVGQVLTRSATRRPDKLALTFADHRYTYAEAGHWIPMARCTRRTA